MAPVAIATASFAAIVEGIVVGWSDFPFLVALMIVPAIIVAVLAHLAAAAQWSRLFRTAALGLGMQSALGLACVTLIGGPNAEGAIIAVLLSGVTVVFAIVLGLPLIIAGGVLGGRRDLEAGDAMLAVGGLWMAGGQFLKIVVAAEHAMVFVPGIGVAVLACAIYFSRAIARRAWCARLSRREIEGWRVRTNTSFKELDSLPPVFGSPNTASAVIERVEMGGVLYRSAPLALPVATMTLPSARVTEYRDELVSL